MYILEYYKRECKYYSNIEFIHYMKLNSLMCVTQIISTPTAFTCWYWIYTHFLGISAESHNADTKDGSISEDEANTLNKDGETQPKKVDDTIKSTPSGSDIIKTFINPILPGLTVTDSSGRRTRSKSPVGIPASLVCKSTLNMLDSKWWKELTNMWLRRRILCTWTIW